MILGIWHIFSFFRDVVLRPVLVMLIDALSIGHQSKTESKPSHSCDRLRLSQIALTQVHDIQETHRPVSAIIHVLDLMGHIRRYYDFDCGNGELGPYFYN